MSVSEYRVDECTAATTHAAISVLSVHGVFEAAALISTRREGDFRGVTTVIMDAQRKEKENYETSSS
jgi:hypothetical protein